MHLLVDFYKNNLIGNWQIIKFVNKSLLHTGDKCGLPIFRTIYSCVK